MKILLTILLLTFFIGCQSQNPSQQTTAKKNVELKPPFNNQGEQEDYWAQELFKKDYEKRSYKVYSNEIKNIDETKFIYDTKSFQIFTSDKALKLIFTKGIIYPQLISGYTIEPRKSAKELDSLTVNQRYFYEFSRGDMLTITNLEELKFLSNSPKIKRFRFWLSRTILSNPQVFLFELINEKATKNTDLKEFIENSNLTFLKAGWIIL